MALQHISRNKDSECVRCRVEEFSMWAGERVYRGNQPHRGHALPSQPCTLQPEPYTLHHTPYTLHPTPYTLQTTDYLYTRHPTPHTLHPTPQTLNPTPYTLHPLPCTLHTLNPLFFGVRCRAARLRLIQSCIAMAPTFAMTIAIYRKSYQRKSSQAFKFVLCSPGDGQP